MNSAFAAKPKYVMALFFMAGLFTLGALEPGDVIINEIYFHAPKPASQDHFQAVELLVVATNVNLNGTQLSDRQFWDVPDKDQCTLQDLGRGFLEAVPAGTLIVIYNGTGTDDTNASDSVLTFYAQSSLFCNVAPAGNAFRFNKPGDSLHLLHLGEQVDFVKYRASDATHSGPSSPGKLNWENGVKGHVRIGKVGDNVGIRFLGNKPDLNDFPAAWMAYSDVYKTTNNLGEPNGGVNTEWVEALRVKSSTSTGGSKGK